MCAKCELPYRIWCKKWLCGECELSYKTKKRDSKPYPHNVILTKQESYLKEQLQNRFICAEGYASEADSFLSTFISLQLEDVIVEVELHLLVCQVNTQLQGVVDNRNSENEQHRNLATCLEGFWHNLHLIRSTHIVLVTSKIEKRHLSPHDLIYATTVNYAPCKPGWKKVKLHYEDLNRGDYYSPAQSCWFQSSRIQRYPAFPWSTLLPCSTIKRQTVRLRFCSSCIIPILPQSDFRKVQGSSTFDHRDNATKINRLRT